MAARVVTALVVSYKDENGNAQTATRGQKITVHKDDLERLEKAGAFDKPKSE